MNEVETYLDPVIGFRTWRYFPKDGRLLPPVFGVAGAWESGVNEARCWAGVSMQAGLRMQRIPRPTWVTPARHDAPAPGCKCGLYAHYDMGRFTFAQTVAVGAISAWGGVIMHEHGFRSRFARILALALPYGPHALGPKDTHGERIEAMKRAGELYDVPVLKLQDLLDYASQFGALIESSDGGPVGDETS